MRGSRLWRFHLSSAILAALAGATPVIAQQAAQPNPVQDGTALPDIVVTASKRSETISRAPLAVSVVAQSALDQASAAQVQDLAVQVPNLQLSANGFSMRGIGSSNNTDQASPTVALHVDGVYSARSQVLSLPIYDISRVEVLRGPQGTLYGRSATAGAVNIITAAPKDKIEASADVSYGNYNEVIARAMINLPITDTLAIRVAGVRRKNDGYYDTEGSTPRNYGIADQTGGRLSVKWTPSHAVTWDASVSYSADTGTLGASIPRDYAIYAVANPTQGLGTVGSVDPTGNSPWRGTGLSPDNGLDVHELALRSNLSIDLGAGFSIDWIAGHSIFRDEGYQQTTNASTFLADNRAIADSQELDAKYEGTRLHGVLGLYYYREVQRNAALINGKEVVPYPYSTVLDPTAGIEPEVSNSATILSQSPHRTTLSRAVFGQITYDATDRLHLIGGLRYTEDEASNEHQYFQVCGYGSASAPGFATGCTVPYTGISDIGQLYGSWKKASWKAVANYDISPVSAAYASVSTGYRGGGVADRSVPSAYQVFQPETVTNYELGLRTSAFDRKVRLNLTGFVMKYNNLQVTSLVQTSAGETTEVTINAARAHVYGIEAEGGWQITRHDSLNGFATWTQAKFASFPNAVNSFLTPDANYNTAISYFGLAQLATPSFDYSGHHLPNAPEWSARVSYSHVFQLGSAGTLAATAATRWQSVSYLSATNFLGDRQSGYTNTDLNLKWQSDHQRYSVEGFVSNLENRAVANNYGAGWGLAYVNYAKPRIYGVRLGVSY